MSNETSRSIMNVSLPKNGGYVLSISLRSSEKWFISSSNSSSSGEVASNTDQSRRGLERLERFSPDDVSKILAYCPNLHELKVCFERTTHCPQSLDTFDTHLRSLALRLGQLRNLRQLDFYFPRGLFVPAQTIASMLREIPLLKSLELAEPPFLPNKEESEVVARNGVNILGRAISSLKQLSRLHLTYMTCYNASWPPCPTLKDLKIFHCRDLRPCDAPRFINVFAPNLCQLELRFLVKTSEETTISKPPHIFQLPYLVFCDLTQSNPEEYQLIHCLKDCINLRRIHYKGPAWKKTSSFVELIASWPDLKELFISSRDSSAWKNHKDVANQLETFCCGRDIKLVLS